MDFIGYLANCLINGQEMVELRSNYRVRSLIRLKLAGYDLELYQSDSAFPQHRSKVAGQLFPSTKFIVHDISEKDIDVLKSVGYSLANLMSFGTDSQVRFYRWKLSPVSRGEEWFTMGVVGAHRPVVNVLLGDEVKHFIECCFPQFEKYREERFLPQVFEYYVLADCVDLPMEVKLANLFILLENLKHSFASMSGNFFFKNGFFYRVTNKKKRASFREILEEMFQEQGMEPDLAKIVKLRNDIIHTGLCGLELEEMFELYASIKDIVAEYLLKLLGFEGQYLIYSSSGRKFQNMNC